MYAEHILKGQQTKHQLKHYYVDNHRKSTYMVQQVHLQLKYSEPLQNIALAFQSNIKGKYLAKLQW